VGNTVDSVMTDSAGRYSIANVPSPDRRRILAFPPAGLQLFQRSATTASVNADTTVDIELVSEGTRGATYASPTLSGGVYYVAPDGPHPWPHTRVVYKAFEGPWYDVYQTSDALGRYDFGRLPPGSGRLGAGNCNDQMQFKPIEVRGDTIADIDVTWLVTTCPGIPF
jgi:hypothetical protein